MQTVFFHRLSASTIASADVLTPRIFTVSFTFRFVHELEVL